MKHLSSILLAAALMAAGTTACFKDPTSDLMNGPSQIVLTRTAITLHTGDSSTIQAELKDDAGNVFDASTATWTSANDAVAVARVDTVQIPGGMFSRAYIRAVAANGGTTYVTVAVGNVTTQLRVLVLPAGLSATATRAVSGTARTDTITATLPDGSTTRDIFTVGDTVTFSVVAGSNVYFDPTASQVSFGANRAYVVSRTDSTRIKVVARQPFRGLPWITRLHYNGPTEVGSVAIDSLRGSDTVLVSRPRFYGTITQTGDTMFVNAQAGSSFSTTASAVRFGATSAITLAATTSQLKVISPATYTGQVTVTNVTVGSATVDSLKTNTAYTINKASFGGTVASVTHLLDTVRLYGTAITKFSTATATASNVTIGGATAWVLLRSADSMLVISRMPSTGPVAVSNVNVGGTIIPTLNSANNVIVPESPTGEANEPANDAPAAITIDLTGATSTNPVVIYGAVDGDGNGLGADADDFFKFTLTATRTVTIQLQFAGTGGGGATNPDLDLLVCNAACSAWVSTSGATAAQPENITLSNRAAGTYNIYVNGWDTGTKTRAYKLIVY